MTIRKGKDSGIRENESKTTPRKWQGPLDQRREEGAATYPNQALVFHSRSGHNWVVDDSEGKESITFQHRSGTAIQMQPNGALQIVAHNSQYNLVFGENRLTITGANDLTVKGDCSLMVYGNYNATVHGDVNWTTTGDFNVTSKNLNRVVRGNIDTQAKNETKKLEGHSALNAHGAVAMSSKDSFTAVSRSDQMHIGGGAGVNMQAYQGNITANIEKQGNFHFQAKDGTFEAKMKESIKFLSESGALHMIAQEAATILAKQGGIKINAQQGDIKVKADSGNLENEAGGSAALKGAAGTHVESSTGSVNLSAPSGTIAGDATAQYHQSGMSSLFSGLPLIDSLLPDAATGMASPATPAQALADNADKLFLDKLV